MKINVSLKLLAITILASAICFASCSTSKKGAVACTKFPVNKHVQARHHKEVSNRKTHAGNVQKRNQSMWANNDAIGFESEPEETKVTDNRIYQDPLAEIQQCNSFLTQQNHNENITPSLSNNAIRSIYSPHFQELQGSNVQLKNENEFNSNNQNSCDTIELTNGTRLIVKVTVIGHDIVKFKNCGSISGPEHTLDCSNIYVVKYANGSRDFFNQTERTYSHGYAASKKTQGMATTSFVLGIIGLFIAGIPLGLLAMIFGISSLTRINKEPDRFIGKGFGIAGVILGFIDVVGVLIILGTL